MRNINFKELCSSFLKNTKDDFKNFGAGFYVFLSALVITLIQTIVYQFIEPSIFNKAVIITGRVGFAIAIALSIFKKSRVLAPTVIMVVDFLSLMYFCQADGLIDYLSTAFFSGFTLEALFKLPVPVWLSVFLFIISFIVSSVAMYLSWHKKVKYTAKIKDNSEQIKEEN